MSVPANHLGRLVATTTFTSFAIQDSVKMVSAENPINHKECDKACFAAREERFWKSQTMLAGRQQMTIIEEKRAN